jgi:dGTPase
MIMDVIQNSTDKPKVGMSSEVSEATEKLRSFMFERVYMDDTAKKEEKKAGFILERLFQYFMEYPGSLPEEYRLNIDVYGLEQVVCDYIAGMTDRYALRMFSNIFIPSSWQSS